MSLVLAPARCRVRQTNSNPTLTCVPASPASPQALTIRSTSIRVRVVLRHELGGLVGLSRGQHAELTAIGIGHDHPADLALADVDASCPEGGQTVDLLLLITVDGWSEVEM
jgi:hypothetical protein